jgi:TPR repeat protein
MKLTQSRKQYTEGMRAYKASDYNTAYKMLKMLADEGNPHAQVAIGSMYQLGLGGLAIDEDEAMRWYELASEKGNGLASNNFASIALSRGDRETAMRWYSKARQQGFRHTPRLSSPAQKK